MRGIVGVYVRVYWSGNRVCAGMASLLACWEGKGSAEEFEKRGFARIACSDYEDAGEVLGQYWVSLCSKKWLT